MITVILFGLAFVAISFAIIYIINHFAKEALEILNQDSRVTSILGNNIMKKSLFGNFNRDYHDGIATSKINFTAKGSLSTGEVYIIYQKREGTLVAYEIQIINSAGIINEIHSKGKLIEDNE